MDIEAFEIKQEINRLKKELKKSDYQAIKYAEGEMSAEEFAPIKEKRKMIRQDINALEARYAEVTNETSY